MKKFTICVKENIQTDKHLESEIQTLQYKVDRSVDENQEIQEKTRKKD